MKFKIKALTLIAITVLTVSIITLTTLINNEQNKTEVIAANYPYVLKAHNDGIAVFKDGNAEPITTFDVVLSDLPERDISRLKAGIYAESLEKVLSLAEDYE